MAKAFVEYAVESNSRYEKYTCKADALIAFKYASKCMCEKDVVLLGVNKMGWTTELIVAGK